MAFEFDSKPLSPRTLGAYLQAIGRIGPFERRQAGFFAARFGNARYRDDFHTLLLFMLAALRAGHPRMRKETAAAVLASGLRVNELEKRLGGEEERIAVMRELALASSDRIAGAVKKWFDRVLCETTLRGMEPLVKDGLVFGSETQPLVICDCGRGSFGFEAYHASETFLFREIPRLLNADFAPLDEKRAVHAVHDALGVCFNGRKAHARQVASVLLALSEQFSIVSGGPGTGKSTVVHAIVRAVSDYHGISPAAIAVCAPTGRAKARLLDAIRRNLSPDDPFAGLHSATIHSLLGSLASAGTFDSEEYCAHPTLPWGLVVVDEASMVDMRLFAQLLFSLSPECRIVLVGDMEQLPPVEAGAVLGDLTADFSRAGDRGTFSRERLETIRAIMESLDDPYEAGELSSLGTERRGLLIDHAVFLTHNFRSDRAILDWWNKGQPDGNAAVVPQQEGARSPSVTHINGRQAVLLDEWLDLWVRARLADNGSYALWNGIRRELLSADPQRIAGCTHTLRAIIEECRILCCVHEGPFGRITVNGTCDRIFRSLKGEKAGKRWHDGQPIIVNCNQPSASGVYNGDLGVILDAGEMFMACFPLSSTVLVLPAERIAGLDAAYAVSVHKAQGSEFGEVMLILPDVSTMPITRSLVYTGITRAKSRITVIDPASVLLDRTALPRDERYGLLRELPLAY